VYKTAAKGSANRSLLSQDKIRLNGDSVPKSTSQCSTASDKIEKGVEEGGKDHPSCSDPKSQEETRLKIWWGNALEQEALGHLCALK
jgi:hypothetical protein